MTPQAIFDIETQDWTTFVLGVIHYPEKGETKSYRWNDRDGERRMAEDLLKVKGTVVAHNMGRFDGLWFLDVLAKHGLTRPCDVVTNGQGMIQLRVDETIFYDSLKIFPMSLAKLTDGGKENLTDLCDCGKSCGGYCAIRRDGSASAINRIESYCVADCVELGKALEHFGEVAESLGITLGRTIGSTAWKSARSDLELPDAGFEVADWERIRAGYHGGRAEVFRTESRAGFACDVNSMYPWALADTPLPIQFRKVSHGRQANQEFAKGFPGVFQATISVPEMFVPPLPVATDSGIAFPYGSVTGFWPRNEIEYALSLGCRVERIHSAATFQRERLIFRPWVEKMFDARIKFGKKSREGAWLKLVLNSLTGKLGSRSERRAIKIWPNMEELRICECENPCECDCGCFQPLDLKGRVWESVVSLRKVEPCAHAEWAAYLTGAARVKLHRQLIAGGNDDAVYCDTDSCWSEKERLGDSGKDLGQWEPTGRYRDFESLGPKTYHAVLAGEEVTAAKGIPNPVWANLKAGKPNPYSGVRGLRRAKKGERFFEWVKGTRVVTPNTGRRLPAPGGLTRPPRMAP